MAELDSAGYTVAAHVVDAFNPQNFRNVPENIFGGGREVALIGVPKAREGVLRAIQVRPCELLLEINDADDLALALLNKPQYQPEVLARSRAAQTGGQAFLDRYASIHSENEVHQARVEALTKTVEQQQNELAALHATLGERDAAVEALQAALQIRDDGILRLQSEERRQSVQLAELHAQLNRRGQDIFRLQAEVEEYRKTIAEERKTEQQMTGDLNEKLTDQQRTGHTSQNAEQTAVRSSWAKNIFGFGGKR
jgi:chromosome segregation ATPase